jgi:hypothetical protein
MDQERYPFPRVELEDEITQPMPLARALARRHHPGDTFARLAETFELEVTALALMLFELLAYHDVTPATLTPTDVWHMRAGLLEVADNVLPVPTRARARSRLQLLLLDVAPVERA